MSLPTRGERNNNPGNINEGGGWRGDLGLEVPTRGSLARFARFDTVENGIRAIAKQLITYQDKHGIHTIAGMISRWAPPADNNDTPAYISAAVDYLGMAPDTEFNIHDINNLVGLTFAIIRQENGRCIYTGDVIRAACQDSLGVSV